ncbi:MAG: hypothetical protein IJR49_00605, partial [Treponema sp.]|nr:hypothetical protein [Treponema sp.]
MKSSLSKISKKIFSTKALAKFNYDLILFYCIRIVPAIVFGALFLLPISMESLNLSDVESSSSLVFPYLLPIRQQIAIRGTLLQYLSFIVYLFPLVSIFLIATFFIKRNLDRAIYIVVYVSLSLYLFCAASCIVVFANCRRWFFILPAIVYAVIAFAFLFHVL